MGGRRGVGAALCSLWGATARAVGSQLAPVLPQVIVSATRMFQSHMHAACLLCLADVSAPILSPSYASTLNLLSASSISAVTECLTMPGG